MNFKLKSWDPFSWSKLRGGLFRLDADLDAVWTDNSGTEYRFSFFRGLTWDGASVPKVFRWYLPNIDEKNLPYTLAGLVHDYLYGSEKLPKDIADDIFRGTMRDAGIPRRKASFAEWLVERFAGGHYGKRHDRNGIRFYGRLKIVKNPDALSREPTVGEVFG